MNCSHSIYRCKSDPFSKPQCDRNPHNLPRQFAAMFDFSYSWNFQLKVNLNLLCCSLIHMLSCPVQGCVRGQQSISLFLASAVVSVMFSVGYTASVYSVLKLE